MESRHLFALACIAGALVASSSVRADEGSFTIGAADCAVVNPNPRSGGRTTWTGGCRDGFADGDGVLQWFIDDTPGSRYEGHMTAGRPDGRGVHDFPQSSTHCEGEFKAGKRQGQGQGTLTLASGMLDGDVTFTERDGRTSSLEFENDRAKAGTLDVPQPVAPRIGGAGRQA